MSNNISNGPTEHLAKFLITLATDFKVQEEVAARSKDLNDRSQLREYLSSGGDVDGKQQFEPVIGGDLDAIINAQGTRVGSSESNVLATLTETSFNAWNVQVVVTR